MKIQKGGSKFLMEISLLGKCKRDGIGLLQCGIIYISLIGFLLGGFYLLTFFFAKNQPRKERKSSYKSSEKKFPVLYTIVGFVVLFIFFFFGEAGEA